MFDMPEDNAERCAVSVHYYTPPTFCILEEDADWGKARTEWGSDADFAELNKYMDMMKETFIDNGIPVIVGEYGLTTKNKTDETVQLYLESVTEAIYSRDMCPVLWDTTGSFYDRTECKFIDDVLLEKIMKVKEK